MRAFIGDAGEGDINPLLGPIATGPAFNHAA
jgi:hypothetical protein